MNQSSVATAVGPFGRSRAYDFVELLKPRLSSLVLFTTAVGFLIGHFGVLDLASLVRLFNTIAGTALVAGGAMALNQYLERETDALMRRTMGRPLPTRRVAPGEALAFGMGIAALGLLYLAVATNLLAVILAAATMSSYLLAYTPLKQRTPLCTLVGSVPGAIPPVIGYVAAAGRIDLMAWSLFAILFVWQLPHFLAIGWMYRGDFACGRHRVLPALDESGRRTAHHIVLFCLLLIPTALLPTLLGCSGSLYAIIALTLGSVFLVCGLRFMARRSQRAARLVFVVSISYLPLLLIAMLSDRY
jgi:heme o synthase